ncbi:hypothetical protein V5799_030901 [Amblyomma americanum]|uniref:Uncharacterized protein n=1 Tax=Amblyomma americanum TaxID=6943 RepID=A0AAQ4ELU7_AMBAM
MAAGGGVFESRESAESRQVTNQRSAQPTIRACQSAHGAQQRASSRSRSFSFFFSLWRPSFLLFFRAVGWMAAILCDMAASM